jgi:leader peptidase (prepilin peptidase)/N-methyltransferase
VLNLTLLADPPSFAAGLGAYFVWFAFVWALLTAGAIDLETYLLPDAITLPGIAAGLLANAFVLKAGGIYTAVTITGDPELDRWVDPVIGAVGGYLVLSLVFVHGYKLLTGRQGMGEGDPKLVAMMGAFLGIRGAIFALCFGALQGLVIGTVLILHRRRSGSEPEPPTLDEDLDEEGNEQEPDPRFRMARVPFGPFLALGALEYLFFGDRLTTLYTNGIANILTRIMGQ